MSRWSRNRQLAYLGGFLLIVILLIGYAFYTYKPIISCTDGRQNGIETGVDCGGNCSELCINQVKPLQVVWSRVMPVSDGVYNAVARVENLNLEAGVKNLKYTFRLVDDRNILVTYRSGETFVNPDESFIIFEGGIDTGSGKPVRAFIEFETPTWERAPSDPPLVVVDSKTFTNDTPARLDAKIVNRSIFDLPRVEVTALLSDAAGNALAAGSTYLERLPRDTAARAFFSWPEALAQAPSFIDIYPRASVFAPR